VPRKLKHSNSWRRQRGSKKDDVSTVPWMSSIDAPKFAEFLDDNKNRKLERESLRTDPELLREAGVSISGDSLKFHRKVRVLEYFLLRSQLYGSDGADLVPYRISDYWSDYAKAWVTQIGEETVHLPFLGKIAFLCDIGNTKRIVCHPESSAIVEKIFVDTGALTFQKDPDRINLMYRRKSCKSILEAYRHRRLDGDTLQHFSNTPFGRALLSIGLAGKKGTSFFLKGEGLLLNEMSKIKTDDDFEKVARLILRYEQKKQAQVSSVIACLEFLERNKHPSESPVGSAPRYRESKRTKKRYERLGHYDIVEGICSIDSRTAANILSKADPYAAYAAFGAFVESYDRTGIRNGQDWAETFAFLSWYTDSLAYVGLTSQKLEKLGWPKFKSRKTKRHKAFLERSVSHGMLKVSSAKDSAMLMTKSTNSEIIDMNIDPKILPQQNSYSSVDYCPSNVYISTNVPVDRELFESIVIDVLQSPSRLKDSQGAFYYPDFRFLMASTLGLSLKSVDQILAYVISTGSELGRRLWFFPAFGNVPRRDRPDQQLMDVVLKPFDSITLNY